MGAKKQKKDERPYRLVYLDSYYVDETPVTNAQFEAFLADAKRKAPPNFRARAKEPAWARLPVSYVTWSDAEAYARWALRRLPTEAEWEKAARGVDGRTYPWGETAPEPGRHASFGEGALPSPVDQHPESASAYGVLDLSGNVWEWCQDQYDQDFYPRSSPRNPLCAGGDPRYRVARGGAVGYSAFTLRTTYRGWNLPETRALSYGFRCAVDASRFRQRKKGG